MEAKCGDCAFYKGKNCHLSPPILAVPVRNGYTQGAVWLRPEVLFDDLACSSFIPVGQFP